MTWVTVHTAWTESLYLVKDLIEQTSFTFTKKEYELIALITL